MVAISAGNLGPGGVETHVRILALALRAAGHRVTVYGTGCHWCASTMNAMKAAGVVFRLPPACLSGRLAALSAMALWTFHSSRGASSLYWIGAGGSHRFLKRMAGNQTVSIYHEIVSPPGPDSPAGRCVREADASIASSSWWVLPAMKAIAPEKPMRVIPFLTAPATVPPPALRKPPGDRALEIGYLGRIERRKRPHMLVREWQKITDSRPVGQAVLHLYGDDAGSGLMRELQDYVRVHRLEERIRIHGAYQHGMIPEILSKLDLVVLPSEWEGLPLVLVESMQHGVPFVATSAGGTVEFGQDNPDVLVTGHGPFDLTDRGWQEFLVGFREFIPRLRAGQVDARRLHHWAESRYGFEAVWPKWEKALTNPTDFFNLGD